MSLFEKCRLIKLKNFNDNRGKLVVIENGETIPFIIKRLFYIYDTNYSAVRGKHANKKTEFVLINLSGSCEIRVTDSKKEALFKLDSPLSGLYIPKMIWKDMFHFTDDCVLLILASEHFSPDEYIRDYKEYEEFMINNR